MVELSIIIVNWNGGHLLRRCIKSIIESPPSVAYDITVVDNASTDDSVSWLRSNEVKERLISVELRVIENTENRGFGKANNQAIRAGDAPLLFLLNSDAEVTANAIGTLVGTLKSDERIGACGPRLINPDGSLQPSVGRNPPTAWEILVSGLRLYKLIPKRVRGELLLDSYWDHRRRRRVNFLTAAAVLVKREMIEGVGGFDERFHMYGEDNEWCLRMVRAGWALFFEPEAVVIHHGGQSSLRRWSSPEKMRVQLEAGFHFQRHCLSRRHVISNLLANYFVCSLERVWRRLRRRPVDDIELMLEVYAKNLKRALRES